MNIHNLMIGNWVNFLIDIEGGDTEYDPENEIYQPMQVDSVSALDEVTSAFFGVQNDVAQLKPIPLTAEILLKNGFKKRKQGGEVRYILTADYYDVYVTEYPDGWWFVEYEDSERGDLPTERIAVRNIHQLQNAFKLFGVEKEIEI